jgi:hypothetical protein
MASKRRLVDLSERLNFGSHFRSSRACEHIKTTPELRTPQRPARAPGASVNWGVAFNHGTNLGVADTAGLAHKVAFAQALGVCPDVGTTEFGTGV